MLKGHNGNFLIKTKRILVGYIHFDMIKLTRNGSKCTKIHQKDGTCTPYAYINISLYMYQGSYRPLEIKFKDFSRTFKHQIYVFQGPYYI